MIRTFTSAIVTAGDTDPEVTINRQLKALRTQAVRELGENIATTHTVVQSGRHSWLLTVTATTR